MINLEQVEKLRQYGDISYEEAKTALEEADGDLLEAIILLEKAGKIKEPKNGGSYRLSQESASQDQQEDQPVQEVIVETKTAEKDSFSEQINKFFNWLGRLVDRGNKNQFKVKKQEREVLSLPITALILLMVLAFWVILPALVIGLFCGYRYVFSGPDLGKESVNKVMDAAARAADNIKKDIKDEESDGENTNN